MTGPEPAVAAGSEGKDAVRRRVIAARAALGPAELEAARAAVRSHLLAGLRPGERTVAAYEPLRTEPGSVELLTALTTSGRDVVVPVTRPGAPLGWTSWPDRRPAALTGVDIVVVPALAVSRAGVRLGRGGGHYDRTLPGVSGRIVALLHRGELVETLPASAHDVAVGAAVTPDGWFEVGAGEGEGRPGRSG